ncbi:MAG: hypothetical protein JWM99_5179 [Verrucomicrobiales bacterium]|nr:hypothetical protein [Verrucomicrobiales bacterium]
MAMIAMTTSSSIKVKPLRLAECPGGRIHGIFTVPLGSGVRQTLLRSQSEARVFAARRRYDRYLRREGRAPEALSTFANGQKSIERDGWGNRILFS